MTNNIQNFVLRLYENPRALLIISAVILTLVPIAVLLDCRRLNKYNKLKASCTENVKCIVDSVEETDKGSIYTYKEKEGERIFDETKYKDLCLDAKRVKRAKGDEVELFVNPANKNDFVSYDWIVNFEKKNIILLCVLAILFYSISFFIMLR